MPKHHHLLIVIPWIISLFLYLALLRLYYYYSSSSSSSIHRTSSLISSSPPLLATDQQQCDYSKGEWLWQPHRHHPPWLYNHTTCKFIKHSHNCIAHGRRDLRYLHYRWKPHGCPILPQFHPRTFLRILQNKHLAFVGDSIARNQLQSLLCMLSTASTPYTSPASPRWIFPPPHNLTVSFYWSPLLVSAIEKSTHQNYNQLFLDTVDPRWSSDLHRIDVLLLSVGHWFLIPALYYQNGRTTVSGCHYCPGMNHSEIGFYGALGKAHRTALQAIAHAQRRSSLRAVVTTFSPHHFEGEWDSPNACARTKPYRSGEKEVTGMDLEMRRVEMAEVQRLAGSRLEVLDVTEMASMRPDGHPGPYMNAFPFADGVKDRVQNDCVHWCLPGPVDTFNQILLEMMKKWED